MCDVLKASKKVEPPSIYEKLVYSQKKFYQHYFW